jgi:hypothetical protein
MRVARLSVILLAAATTGAASPAENGPAAIAWRTDGLLQAGVEQSHASDVFGAGAFTADAAEGRLNLYGQCSAGWCEGAAAVLRPRLDARAVRGGPELAPRPVAWPEAYLLYSSGSTQVSAGKRLLGWGPGLAYSPSNRLFPDNGAVSPRREVPGKPMLTLSTGLPLGGQVSAMVADPRTQDLAGDRIGGTFGALRAEWRGDGAGMSTLGIVAGGGGGLAPYAAAYAQQGLGDAFTIGAEASVSHRYGAGERFKGLAQNRGASRADVVGNIRYGLSSGAEVGAELIYNGFALSDAELANPAIAALPSTGRTPGWTRPLHPLVQRRYALLQFTSPSLFGNKRWGLTVRTLRGLDRRSTDSFAELSWSVRDAMTLYLGYTRSIAEPALAVSRPLARNAYLILETFF